MNYNKSLILIISAIFFFNINAIAQQADTSKTHHAPHVRRVSTAQTVNFDKHEAATYFSDENYIAALNAYLDQYKDTPKDLVVNYRIGFCYLKTNVGKAKAVPYLEYASKEKEVPKDVYLLLGKAYQYANKFDDAIAAYGSYKEGNKLKPDMLAVVDRLLETCENAKELVAKPVDVKFENLGKSINSSGADYGPYVNAAENFMVFSSQRQGNTGGSYDNPEDIGQYPADVYYSIMKDGVWQKAKNIGYTINTEESEETVGLNAAGNKMILFFDSKNDYSDLYLSTLQGKQWQKPESFGPNVNTKSVESGGTLSSDGNTLIFSSDRKGGMGGKDLYKSKRLPNGDWGTAENLGNTINSLYDEDGPFLSADDKTLYFSSKGFNSMGGYDYFKSEYNAEKDEWSEPVNLGYPINTSDDNIYFSVTADKKHAYIAAQRDDGFGDLDIYRITFNSEPGASNAKYTIVQGTVVGDSAAEGKIKIILTDGSNKTVGIYNSQLNHGKFLMIIPAGKYHITTEANGFKPYSEDFTIADKSQPADMQKSIYITK
jgi:hypothetical protein